MTKKKKQGRPNFYPWDKWLLNRKRPFIVEEHQYSCSQRTMAVMFRNQARLRGVKVGVHKLENGGLKIFPKNDE